MTGRLIGVGTGPGDPELLTLKAMRALGEADVVAHFAKRGRKSNARSTVEEHLRPDIVELPLCYPVTTEIARSDPAYRRCITAFFEEAASSVAAYLEDGRIVAVLSEGDPLFYGSYMHLHVRLADRYPTEVIPGITAMSGCWSVAGLPIAQGDDMLGVFSGTMSEDMLARHIETAQACVVMKVGRNLAKIRRALQRVGRINDAVYVERATTPAMKMTRLAEKPDDEAPYFSIVLVPGWSNRR
ncbi:MAG: precorrin-2 C(20)-methyltransferase [Pseudomonadota bacterium]